MTDKIKELHDAYEEMKAAKVKVIKATWIAPDGRLMKLANIDDLRRDAEEKSRKVDDLLDQVWG